MLVHLGHGASVHGDDVIALTDLQRPMTEATAHLLDIMRASGAVIALGPKPKTMLLCRDRRQGGSGCICYLSCVGLRTLRARMTQPFLAGLQGPVGDDKNKD